MMDATHQLLDPARSHPVATSQRQAGAATLAVAVIMLLVVSVLVFHSHTAGWLEQRATANQARAKQAHAAAEAGIDTALAALNADTSRSTYLEPDTPGNLKAKSGATLPSTVGVGPSYSVTFEDVPSPDNTFRLVSTGGSDCATPGDLNTCTGQASVSQVVRAIGFSGLPAVSNFNTPPFSDAAAFFWSFFAASPAEVEALTTAVSNIASIGPGSSGLVWFGADLILDKTVGETASPVLLVVNGNLTMKAGGVINGFVYVTGNLSCDGCDAQSIVGAVAVVGNHTPQVNVTPANTALAKLQGSIPRFTKVIGTWRDW